MKALLLVAHGSRRESSNGEIRELTDRLREDDSDFDIVDCAFLELAEPSIPDGIRCLIRQGASEVVVLPYFLSAGRHVVEDIPGDIKQVVDEHPDVEIRQAPYLGACEGVVDLLLKQAVAPGKAASMD
jgi:sirohydrochlorin ferrochelatase